MAMRLEGTAFTWFTSPPKPTQEFWKDFSVAFLAMYAGGLTPIGSALKALKVFQKDHRSMHDFGTELTSLLHRANIYQFHLQVEYLIAKLPPKIAEALVYQDPKNLEVALSLCTRLENPLNQMEKLKAASFTHRSTEPNNIYQEQNYQQRQANRYQYHQNKDRDQDRDSKDNKRETRRCFKCD
ncbi:hypothetical protein BD560DRAFT_476566 [Blakeslea trispora]|nr:hypothetical protein BD560DRAFT_476566 [Blakeslea trispora]